MRVVHEAAPPAYGRCPWLFTSRPAINSQRGTRIAVMVEPGS